jgi:hypothetical protein
MGFIGNLLADNSSSIGSWIDKNIFGGSGKTGGKIGGAASGLLRLLPFEQGGMVHYVDPHTGRVVKSVQKKKKGKKSRGKK